MAYRGFGKNSGPGGASRPETPFGQFPRAPSPPHPLPDGNLHSSTWGAGKLSHKQHSSQTYQRPPNLHPQVSPNNSRNGAPAETKYMGRTGSPYSRSPEEPPNNPRGVINRALSPLVYEKNQYVRGPIPRTEVQLHPFSSPVWGSQLRPSQSNYNITPPQKGISSMSTADVTYKSRPIFQSNRAIVPLSKQTISPTHPSTSGVSPDRTMFHPHEHKRSVIDYRDLDAPEEMPSPSLSIERNSSGRDTSHSVGYEKPFTSSPVWTSQTNSSTDTTPQNQERMSSALTATDAYRMPQTRNADVPLPKRTRSPTLSSAGGGFQQDSTINLGVRRASDFQNQSQSPTSRISNRIETAVDSSMQFPAVKRTKIPIPSSSSPILQDNLDPTQEEDRELQAKAKRLARFKDELSQPVQSDSIIRNQKVPAKKQHQFSHEKQKFSEEPMVDAMRDSTGGDSFSEYEGVASPNLIVGLCPDMCPEPERAERERKGDLDQYERLDGDRNLSSEFLAVKKYTRTAEREAMLIRPMPILQKTMGYLLNLLSEPYDDRFLGLYNFLWDRMRAIRMDLRMQHIFNLEAIKMLEQMIRLHIIAMHELCEYTKGEGFSEGFDAHLNIEQMNKTSVELFQLYDDHRKRGIHVPSECEFRGYYALLKLDKHPGYKVEPAELSLDLAKMTPEIRQTPVVLFARDVARACRTGNFISFFRLANKSSYLQACLMHAHFSKLRTQALASLHSGLQMNQGIPVAHVAKWLGMEEEDMGELLEYHGFSVKDFEEPYMMKENAFINADSDFPVRRSQLVDRKRSGMIADDVSNPSITESYAAGKVSGIHIKKGPELTISKTTPTITPVITSQLHDEEMLNVGTISSPKGIMQMPSYNESVNLKTLEKNLDRHEVQVAPASPFIFSFSSGSPASYQSKVESPQKPKYESVFRNSFGRTKKQDLDLTTPMIPDAAEEIRHPALPLDSVVHTPVLQPSLTSDLQDDEPTGTMEEDESDEVSTSNYDKEVAEARLKLILRIWKRRAVKKKELRERKQLAANTAMSLLPMGPPIWHFEAPSSNYGMFNIDHVMSKRQEIQERSWSVLNPSYVVAAKLVERNPDAECLCWKVVVCSQEEIPVEYSITQHNKTPISALSSWFLSKLTPASYDGDDLLVLSPDLAIWRGWIPGQSGVGPTCCLSVIKNTTFDDLNEAITGANAVLFPLLENIPLELQKKQLNNLIASLPCGARMPLLILSDYNEEELDASSVAKDLGLHDIDKLTITAYNIIFLKDKGKGKMDVFFSNECLKEGLEWVASESPPQIAVREIKIRDLVFHHLNSTLGILGETSNGVGPNSCIAAYNEALDRSMKDVAAAVDANPTGWPCPEIGLLEQSSDEYRVVACYLPSTGWSSPSRTDWLMHTLHGSMLPAFDDDLSWLSTGLNARDDIEDKKSRLENCLIDYLTTTCQIMGLALAQKEVTIMLQNCARLELHSNTYYLVPEWVSIFRRIFNWCSTNLTSGEVSSTYILELHYPQSNFLDMETRGITFSPPYMAHPSLDELVEVWRPEVLCFQPDLIEPRDASRASPTAYADAPASNMVENEERSTKDRNSEDQQLLPTSASKGESDKLSELLEKCRIMQNLIDKKLSIYF